LLYFCNKSKEYDKAKEKVFNSHPAGPSLAGAHRQQHWQERSVHHQMGENESSIFDNA
jgi:hypothetical protein